MGHAMIRAGLVLQAEGWVPEVVHAHDWLVAHPAIALAELFDAPIVSTMHATEAGGTPVGCPGISADRCTPSSRGWPGVDTLITCSASMADEITELFGPG